MTELTDSFLTHLDKIKDLDKKIMESEFFFHYMALLDKLEEKEKILLTDLSEYIVCTKGCSDCCILESLLPIEAALVYNCLKNTSDTPKNMRHENITPSKPLENGHNSTENNTPCILLVNKFCSIYKNRPIICRTHGYPIMFDGYMDYCPLNFKDLNSLGFQYFLNLDAVNQALIGINTLFLKEFKGEKFNIPDLRIPITEILERSV